MSRLHKAASKSSQIPFMFGVGTAAPVSVVPTTTEVIPEVQSALLHPPTPAPEPAISSDSKAISSEMTASQIKIPGNTPPGTPSEASDSADEAYIMIVSDESNESQKSVDVAQDKEKAQIPGLQIRLFHSLFLHDLNQAEEILKVIRGIDPLFGIQDPIFVQQISKNLRLKHIITTEPDVVSYSPTEEILNWLLSHDFAIGDIANEMIRSYSKLHFSQALTPGSPTTIDNLDKVNPHNDIISKILDRTELSMIADDILVNIYEYSSVVLQKLIEKHLSVARIIDGHSLTWHIMRVARYQLMVGVKSGVPGQTVQQPGQTYAYQIYNRLKGSPGFKAHPRDFEGCNDMPIMTDLLGQADFVSQMQKPLEELGGQYLIETVTDDRVQNALRNRGSPDPKVSIFASTLLDSEVLLRPLLASKRAELNTLNADYFNLFGHSLLNGPYTASHLQCLKIIVGEMNENAFLPNGVHPSTSPAEDKYRLSWKPLHVAFHKLNLLAWKRRLDSTKKVFPKLSSGAAQLAFGSQDPKEGKPLPPVQYHYLQHVPSNHGSHQFEIISWLYSLGIRAYGLDRYGRTPLMCLPINREWMETVEGMEVYEDILTQFLKLDLALLQQTLGVNMSEATFRMNLLNWRQKEYVERQRSLVLRERHLVPPLVQHYFSFVPRG